VIRKVLVGTAMLMAITILSKFIGFAREMILLERVGIGAELDVFLVLFGIANVVTGALGICIVTSVTPLAGRFSGAQGARRLMGEGLAMGGWTWIVATFACLVYVALAARHGGVGPWLLALAIPGIVPFSLLAEYQVGLFLARNRRTPVIAGNIIISLPLALALLVIDMNILAYAIGLVAAFALRAALFAWLLVRDGNAAEPQLETPRISLFGRRLWRTLAGGSAMLAISVVYVTATMAARRLGAGEATLLGYGLKIPLFVLTSVWFVMGTGFFADLVAHGAGRARSQLRRFSAINLVLLAIAAGAVMAARELSPQVTGLLSGRGSAIVLVVEQSLPFLPLIAFVPVIEMIQRLAVTEDRHKLVLAMSTAVIVAGAIAQLSGVSAGSRTLVFLSPALAAGAGGVVGLALLATAMQTNSRRGIVGSP
jgi:hypothetical protein